MASQLPNLPVYKFHDPTVCKFHLSSKCTSKNGFNFVKNDGLSFANRPLDSHSIGYLDNDSSLRYNPKLTYGRTSSPFTKKFVPHHAIYANQCLTFHAYYKQPIPSETEEEHYLLHYVHLHYFLEDDTITVIEPKIMNSGFLGGRIIRRRRIEKPDSSSYWHWKDLNTDMDINLQGIIFHTLSCDYFTKEFMRSQGIDCDPVEVTNKHSNLSNKPSFEEDENYHLYRRNSPETKPPIPYQYQGEILSFRCIWENEDDDRNFVLHFYLEDGTLAVKELLKRNDGRDPCPKLVRRMRVAKDYYYFENLISHERETINYYEPKDLRVGETVHILGRNLLLTSCDYKTKHLYKVLFQIDQPDDVDLDSLRGIKTNTFGDELTQYRRRISDRTVTYPKDELKLILNGNRCLRYSAEMISSHPEDKSRKFLLYFYLADDTIKITEIKQDNSGIMGGKFLSRVKIPKGKDYVSINDLEIGAILEVHKHYFRITGADLEVYNYVHENKDSFSLSLYENLRKYFEQKGLLKLEETKESEMERDTCYLNKLEREDKLEKVTFPNKYFDPDAPCLECRYPMVIDGKLMEPKCVHAKEYTDGLLDKPKTEEEVYMEKKPKIFTRHPSNDIMDFHDRSSCPADSCLGEYPYDKRFNKRVTFVD